MMFQAIKKYAVFSGRASRKEFWLFTLLYLILLIVAKILDEITGLTIVGEKAFGVILTLGIVIPSLSVAVRRLHDTDRSGWWLLIGLIPILGGLILLVFYCINGTSGENRFGEDPKR